MVVTQLPASIRSSIVEGWKELDEDGRFGPVTEARMRAAVSDFENRAWPKDDFTAFVYTLCDQMMRAWDATWRGFEVRSEGTGQVPAPSATAERPAPATPSEADYLTRLWRGDISLPITFWLWGFVGNLILGAVFSLYVKDSGSAGPFLLLLYYGFILVAVWRSAEKYKGPKVWSSLARIAIMLGIGRTLLDLWLQSNYLT